MTTPTWTTPTDVKDRWLSTDKLPDDKIIQAWISDAETYILAEIDGLADRLTNDPSGELTRRMVYVTVQLTSQALKNPDGVRQRSQTSGVFTDAVTFGTETISQAMTLTPAHRAMLADKSSKRNFGLDMTPQTTTSPLAHAWVNGPDDYAPGTGVV